MCSGHHLELLGQVNPVIARVCPGLQPPMYVYVYVYVYDSIMTPCPIDLEFAITIYTSNSCFD